MDKFDDILKKAAIMKKHMEAKGLKRAKAKCPYCEGFWHAQLNEVRQRNGRHGLKSIKNHLWFKCDGTCGSMMMS